MPEMPDVVAGNTITVAWGNQIRDRTVQRYATAAARAASLPSPTEGDLSWLQDQNNMFVYDGTTWQPVGIPTNDIDGYTEVATSATGASPSVEATVALVIPAGWASWKCFAMVTGILSTGTSPCTIRIRVDGTDLQAQVVGLGQFAIVGRRSGMTTTGTRNVELIVSNASGVGTVTVVALYARARRLT